MDPTMSEIRLFAGNFAPVSWAFCNGQSIAISNNEALFALLGTTFGGDGQQTFNLPDLRGRVAIGTGTAPGLPTVTLGDITGVESYSLTNSTMAAHNHVVTGAGTVPMTGTITASIAVNLTSDSSTPKNNFLGSDGSGAGAYDTTSSSTGTTVDTLNTNAVSVNTSGLSVSTGSIQVGIIGNGIPVENRQPYLGLNYIICVEGIFPSRN
jgi:microcystin-dependent protein